MNIKNIILTSLFAVGCVAASAQQEVKKEEVFQPHWYGGVQVGFQNTLGEIDWSDLNSLNAQLSVGYQFTSLWGARLALNGFQSKAGTGKMLSQRLNKDYQWSWNYIAPTVDVTFNVTNALFGFNADRKVDFSVFAGLGVNFAWGNEEAKDAHLAIQKDPKFFAHLLDSSCPNRLLWEDSKSFFLGQFGADVDYNITRNLSVGLEFGANMVGDAYNSKKAGNADWYFNTLLGAKYKFGETTKTRYTTIENPCEPRVEYIHDTIYVEVKVPVVDDKKETIRRDIFFVLRGSEIAQAEWSKINDLVAYMLKYPESKISITGYADRGTGNPRINVGYAEKRAKVVADTLADKYGIARDRMIVTSKGDTEQPYSENALNRVSICIAE